MGILKRIKDNFRASTNAFIDKHEDVEKLSEQYLKDMKVNFGNIKASTASVMANRASLERKIEKYTKKIAEAQNEAENAVLKGDEDSAAIILRKKCAYERDLEELKTSLTTIKEQEISMKKMLSEYSDNLDMAETKVSMLKTKNAVCNMHETVSKTKSNFVNFTSEFDAFTELEDKINSNLDKLNAMEELENELSKTHSNYSSTVYDSQIKEEIEKIKEKLNVKPVENCA